MSIENPIIVFIIILVELNCFLWGEDPRKDIFTVKISNSEPFSVLKRNIKDALKPMLDHIVVVQLELLILKNPLANLEKIRLEELKDNNPSPLPTSSINEYIPNQPETKGIHVIVIKPDDRSSFEFTESKNLL